MNISFTRVRVLNIHIRDFFVVTLFNEKYEDAILRVRAKIRNCSEVESSPTS
ncbi:MAG: hypothetical protein QXJ19_06880 [Candidatus Bathyarchaeia archaeon]|nr:hypothetical protein [Candidatus Bathyarchaeota archaeon]